MDVSVVPKEHVDWMDRLPIFHEDQHRVFVHAGVHHRLPLEEQPEQKMMWMLYDDADPGGWRGKFVVHGHHQFEDGPIILAARADMDTFAWATGRLVVARFDDEAAGAPAELIEVKGEPSPAFSSFAA